MQDHVQEGGLGPGHRRHISVTDSGLSGPAAASQAAWHLGLPGPEALLSPRPVGLKLGAQGLWVPQPLRLPSLPLGYWLFLDS